MCLVGIPKMIEGGSVLTRPAMIHMVKCFLKADDPCKDLWCTSDMLQE